MDAAQSKQSKATLVTRGYILSPKIIRSGVQVVGLDIFDSARRSVYQSPSITYVIQGKSLKMLIRSTMRFSCRVGVPFFGKLRETCKMYTYTVYLGTLASRPKYNGLTLSYDRCPKPASRTELRIPLNTKFHMQKNPLKQ